MIDLEKLTKAYTILNEKLDEYKELCKLGIIADGFINIETINNCSDILLNSFLIFSSISTPQKLVLNPIEDQNLVLGFYFYNKELFLTITSDKLIYKVHAIGNNFPPKFSGINDLLYWVAS